jgi:pimeloyl-ACP methyl ester carboxylesterase
MSKNHFLLKTVFTATTTLYAINQIIGINAKNKNICSNNYGSYYPWKEGNIYYTKTGKGSPILLIHDLDVSGSSYEWSKIRHQLAEDHTVYTVDLLGCGQSDKPALTYTNYLYVQMISAFIRDVIKNPTDIITSGDSASIAVMAKHANNRIIHKILMINPPSLKNFAWETTKENILMKKILFSPLLGTSLYNYYVSEKNITGKVRRKFYHANKSEIERMAAACYQSAHEKESKGRYLFSSKLCGYTNINLSIGLANMDHLYLIQGTARKNASAIADAYVKINPMIQVKELEFCNMIPQLERPHDCVNLIQNILNE